MPRTTSVPRSRPLSFESLETRVLLSGDVRVLLRSGDLYVRGDANENRIEISESSPGMIRITGVDGTTVNRGDFVDVPAHFDDLKILMRPDGADDVTLFGPLDIPGDLYVVLSDGVFSAEGSAGPIEIGEDLSLRGGLNGHVLLLNEVHVAGDTYINTRGEVTIAAARATLPDVSSAVFSDSLNINNPYFPLIVGAVSTSEAIEIDEDTGETIVETIVVEVLPDTRIIQGVEVRVVRDRVYLDGLLIEDTFDWHAQDDDGNVWYFGEDVTNFEYDDAGNVIATDKDGSWESGVDGGQAGIIMEANPQIGDRYYQEFQSGGVLDVGEVLALDETMDTAIGTFHDVLRTEDTTVREPFGLDNKFYAPGVGLIGELKFDIEDDEVEQTVRLISLELNGIPVTQLVPTTGFTGSNPAGESKGGVDFDGLARIHAGGPVLIRAVEFADQAQIVSRQEAILVDTALSDYSWISARDVVTLREVDADGRLAVLGDDEVFIFESEFDELRLRLGPSDNAVTVRGSEFDLLDADGGPGTNTFLDDGDNDFGKLVLRRFA